MSRGDTKPKEKKVRKTRNTEKSISRQYLAFCFLTRGFCSRNYLLFLFLNLIGWTVECACEDTGEPTWLFRYNLHFLHSSNQSLSDKV